MIKKLGLMVLPLIAFAVLGAGSAQAYPGCTPANGPLGYLWPKVARCQLFIPGAGALGNIPMIMPPQNVPYPANPATPFYPFYIPG